MISVINTDFLGIILFIGLPILIFVIYLISKYRTANEIEVPMEDRKIETYQTFSVAYDFDLNRQNDEEDGNPLLMLVFFKVSENFDIGRLWKEDYYVDKNWQFVNKNPSLIEEGKFIICGIDEDFKIQPILPKDFIPTFSREYWEPIYRFILAHHEGLYFSGYFEGEIGSILGMRYDILVGSSFRNQSNCVKLDQLKMSLLEKR